MKLCSVALVVVLVAFVCVDAQNGGGVGELVKKCGEETNVDKDTMKKSLVGGNADGKLNCPTECICKKIGIMNADGSPNQAKADELTGKMPEAMKTAINGCMKSMKAGGKNCQSGGDFAKCMIPKMAQMRGKQ